MSSPIFKTALVALMLATGSALAACDDDSSTTSVEQPTEERESIAAIAAGNEDFETLTAALDAAGLVETLDGEGTFTVFAPTDEAFAALPAGALDALLADETALTDVLLYHVSGETVDAAGVVGSSTIDTLNGERLDVVVDGDRVTVGGATVVTTDIRASNGIIHVIDTVLLPPGDEPSTEVGTIAEEAAKAGDFTTLLAAVEAAGLSSAFSGDDPLTVFAPTDAAFDALPEGTVEALLEDQEALSSILLYHVVSGDVDAAAVTGSSLLRTLNGSNIKVEGRDGGLYVGSAKIVVTDIVASNGRIHVIDAVASPPASIAAIASDNDDLSTLVTALGAADLVETMAGDEMYTVFAPTNEAFEKLPAGVLDTLLADIPALTSVLLYHVVPGEVDAASVFERVTLETASGESIGASLDAEGAPMMNDASIIATDIPASNGIVHVIDAVLLPPN